MINVVIGMCAMLLSPNSFPEGTKFTVTNIRLDAPEVKLETNLIDWTGELRFIEIVVPIKKIKECPND